MQTDDVSLDNLILDMDGVLWRGETPTIDLPAFFAKLRANSINFVTATNNASKTPEQYVAKFARLGVELEAWQVVSSAETTAAYLARHYPTATPIYVLGDEGLREGLRQRGFHLVSDHTQPCAIVTVGFTQHVTYNDFALATYFIRNGARFIGSNPDVTFPHELGRLPGAGSFLALLRAATDCEPTVIGKPNRFIFEEALQRLGSDIANTAMVGDRLDTDIKGAQAVGLNTILVLSGITTAEDLAMSDVQPDFVFDDIGCMARMIWN